MLKFIRTYVQLILAHNESEESNRLCASLMHHLKLTSSEKGIITINELSQMIKCSESSASNSHGLLSDQNVLVETCKTLSLNRHLVYLQHGEDIGQSLLMLDKKVILSKVHSCVAEIKEELGNNVGVFKKSQLINILSKSLGKTMEPELAIKYLLLTQFCTEIAIDHLISVPGNWGNTIHYFFPSLVLASRPTDLLLHQSRYSNLFMWGFKCIDPHQFFTPRFLHTLFVQLIRCENEATNTEYNIWENGILLVHGNGTRSIIEVTEQTSRVYFAIQCIVGFESQLVKQRSILISLIKSLVHKTCRAVEVEEFLILPQNSYPENPSKLAEIPLAKVAVSVIKSSATVPFKVHINAEPVHILVKDLLHFDSFHAIDEQILQDLFSLSTSSDSIPSSILSRICDAVKCCSELTRALEEDEASRENMTYQQLYKELTKYSIFTDGNLYVSSVVGGQNPPQLKNN